MTANSRISGPLMSPAMPSPVLMPLWVFLAGLDTPRWWTVVGDHYCVKFKEWHEGEKRCFVVYHLGGDQ